MDNLKYFGFENFPPEAPCPTAGGDPPLAEKLILYLKFVLNEVKDLKLSLNMSNNQQLISQLINEGYLKTPGIIKAFQEIDRADFIPKELYFEAYENYPLPIGFGQTISQPATVAFMLELLKPKEGEKILDVGCGSGWQTALLAYLVGSSGQVIGLEIKDDLVALGRKNVEKYNFKNVKMLKGDGWEGLPQESPFDKIIVAAAAEVVPLALKEQLKIGGRLVIPVGKGLQDIIVIDKIGADQYKEKAFPGFVFVPLINEFSISNF